jgi:hypothetical protein
MVPKRFLIWLLVVGSLALGAVSCGLPLTRMPLDYESYRSGPLSAIWLIGAVFSITTCGRKGLWYLLGSPLALYWPILLAVSGLPACYAASNCA